MLLGLMAEIKMGRSPTVPPAPPATFIPNGSSDFWRGREGREGGRGNEIKQGVLSESLMH